MQDKIDVSIAEEIAPQYRAAIAADAVFSRELARVYGERNAGDARYKLKHDDPVVEAAKAGKVAADDAYIGAVRTARARREIKEDGKLALGHDMSREQKLDLIYEAAHPDFKGIAGNRWPSEFQGKRTILRNDKGTTVLSLLEQLPDSAIAEELPYALQKLQQDNCTPSLDMSPSP